MGDAKGPTYARHMSEKLWDDQFFAMQIDAHTMFVQNWDSKAISQFKNLKNEYAIMSTYLSNYYGGLDENGHSLTHTAPIICETKMNRDGMLTHLSAQGPLPSWPKRWKNTPMISPYLGAGLMFNRGHRLKRVPYDCCLEQLFAGEEFSIAARAWTHGYDFYGPSEDFAFHPYNRPKKERPPTYLENWKDVDGGKKQASAKKRIRHILKMEELPEHQRIPLNTDHIEEYGLGEKRELDDYLDVFSLELRVGAEEKNHCKDATRGVLHDNMHIFVRKNGRGIDFRYVRYGWLHTGTKK